MVSYVSALLCSLGGNKWTGTIPPILGFLPDLQVLAISRVPPVVAGNPIPQDIEYGLVGHVPSFQRALRLTQGEQNFLTQACPYSVLQAKLTMFVCLLVSLGFNHLGGTLSPDFLGDCTNKASAILVDLQHNQIHG
jgi:hypothetical protein